jgi:hypothetical protein
VVIAYDDGDKETTIYPDIDGDIELLSASVKLKQKVACASKRERSSNKETVLPEKKRVAWGRGARTEDSEHSARSVVALTYVSTANCAQMITHLSRQWLR